MSVIGRLVVHGMLIAVVTSGAAAELSATPGTQYPSQKIIFSDPLTGRTVWRMTTDGSTLGALHVAPGDQSSESRSFSPDSTQIVYAKSGVSGAGKPDGVYVMDLESGVETYVAPAPWYAAPIFARDGSGEVYYYEPVSGSLVVRAVNTGTYQVRTVVTLPEASWQEKIEVNADGSYLAVHPRMADGRYRTVIVTPQGSVHPNWTLSEPTSDDGAQWSPTEPEWICAVRDGERKIWNIQTLEVRAGRCDPAHSAWHPNGAWFFQTSYLWDVNTGVDVLPGTGAYPTHPNINPTDGERGAEARVVLDERNWFFGNTGRPWLYVQRLRDAMTAGGDWRLVGNLTAVHYSSMVRNSGHVHAHWSWDGRYILWTSDLADLRDGAPPGGTGGGTDLFILPMDQTAMEPPAAQSVMAGNTSGEAPVVPEVVAPALPSITSQANPTAEIVESPPPLAEVEGAAVNKDPPRIEISLFADDFKDGDFAGWTASPLGGEANWSAATGALEYSGLSHTQLRAGSPDWADYSVEAKFQLFSLENYPGGLRGRVDPLTGAGYEVWFFPANGEIGLFRVTGWSIDSPGLTQLGRATVPFDTTDFHLLRLTFGGPTITVRYDGVEVISATDGQYGAGAIAIDVSNRRVQWDDVRVSSVALSPTEAVSPEPPQQSTEPPVTTDDSAGGSSQPQPILTTPDPISVTMTTDLSPPRSLGTTILFTAIVTGGVPPYQYQWWISDNAGLSVVEGWTASSTFAWTPSIPSSDYRVGVLVRGATNIDDLLDSTVSILFPIEP